MWGALPRDIIIRIIRFMDIDSRRALGVYCKLQVPYHISEAIENIPRINQSLTYCFVEIGPYKLLHSYKNVRFENIHVWFVEHTKCNFETMQRIKIIYHDQKPFHELTCEAYQALLRERQTYHAWIFYTTD